MHVPPVFSIEPIGLSRPRGLPRRRIGVLMLWAVALCACVGSSPARTAEADNPLRPIPAGPLGTGIVLTALKNPPTPARVRLGRWLFFDRRLSRDGTIACASCHQPEYGFSNRSAVAIGVGGQRGRRKVPPILNLAIAFPPTNFTRGPPAAYFWDGRVTSLERQALEPVANAREMGSTHATMTRTLSRIAGYRPYFIEAFGDGSITPERVAHALADYERTRMSGNSPFDRWHSGRDETAVSERVKRGYGLFAGRAQCGHCHPPPLFTRGGFHNIGIGWDSARQTFADDGRHAITKDTVFEDWPGTFKVPTLREVARRPPYMHDGSIATLRDVVEYYNRGANPNPYLSAFIHPLGLSADEVADLVAFLESLNGDGWQDRGPAHFLE
jgi:cytochrome c peroxidase